VIRWVLGVLGLTAALMFGRLAHADDALGVDFELVAGGRVAVADSAPFSDRVSPFRVSLGGGVYPTDRVRLGIEGRFDVADDARHHELVGTATYFVDLRLVELFAGVEVGRYWRDVDAPSFSDAGFVLGVQGGVRLDLVGPLSCSVLVGHTISESRHENPVWLHATQVGAALGVRL